MTTMLTSVLTWPIVALLITGSWHFVVEAVWPGLQNFFVAPVLSVLLLAYGAWAGSRTVAVGGNFMVGIVAGAILGLLPLMLDVVGFGVILGRGVDNGLLAGIFGFSMVLFGAMLGAGYRSSTPLKA